MPPKPRIRIPVHVAVYTVAFLPGAVYAYYWYENVPTDEDFEKELRKKYSANIENSRDKHTQISNFLQNIKDPDSEQQKQMQQVLLGGRGQQKRLYAVDERIFGTEKAAKLQQKQEMARRKKNRKKKRKGGDDSKREDTKMAEVCRAEAEGCNRGSVQQSVVAVALVGALVLGASFFISPKRS